MPRPSSKGSRLSAEERLLEQQRAEILRKQQELEKRLKRLPAVLEAKEQQRRDETKRRAALAGPALSPDMRPVGRRASPRRRELPSQKLRQVQFRTLLFVLILAGISLMLWRVLSTY